MAHPITTVDSFTHEPFAGNPAGVCLLDRPTTVDWMRAVAAELNLAETAFAVRRDDGDLDLRWFTPDGTEIDLCGHATLATAHVLGGSARFHTRSGPLTCTLGVHEMIEMDFPARQLRPVAEPPDWAGALRIAPDRIVQVWDDAPGWGMVELLSADDVRSLEPDLGAVAVHGDGILVVAPGDRDGIDSVSRMFAPGVGIAEDPVTGSSATSIGPWLAGRTGGTLFVGEQASRRGGTIGMRVEGDRVVVIGRAVTVLEGTIASDPPAA
jgi:PhzF family phenazine biosynthesis protein